MTAVFAHIGMPNQWLIYWRKEQIEAAVSDRLLDHAASDQLGAVRPGDSLYRQHWGDSPSMDVSVLEFNFSISRSYIDDHASDPFISWNVYADEMEPREGTVSLRDVGWEAPRLS